ncbi:MAG: DnaJ C-terminal domain-containing protein [Desulfobacca sp.]|uniref:DnaJ C-terminal domain-containing protein n=1 Tax=Desulfobacca sp. TaxID=2067990 RepID=UPI0040499A1F
MPTMPEYYRILGVSPQADLAEIKRRYRLLALKFHPDRNPLNPQAAAHFRKVAEAYAAICQRYQRRPKPEADQRQETTDQYHCRTFVRQHVAEFFETDADFEDLASFAGPDYRYDLQIPFFTAMRGTEQEIAFQCLVPCSNCQATGMRPGTGYQDCPTCAGRGRLGNTPGLLKIGALCSDCQGHGKIMSHPCPHCHGLGYRAEWRKYRISIPSGIEDGTRIHIRGEGGEGFAHGPRGHLVVVVHVEPHSFYTRHNNDLYGTLVVSLAQAVWGATIEIPTPWGPKFVELPRGSRTGQSFLFPGLGVPANGNHQAGDLIITIQVRDDTKNCTAECQPGYTSSQVANLAADG